jgi:hypothetical protein
VVVDAEAEEEDDGAEEEGGGVEVRRRGVGRDVEEVPGASGGKRKGKS